MEKIVESFELYGKSYRLETGELAKQATGAVLVTQGETTCLVTAVVSKEQKDYDFFPLTVDFIEKMYAVGRIPGGYLKREAKPSDKGTLTARMIDRPIRPGFADGFKQEVHIVATTLACDGQNPPDCICVGGASAALLCGGGRRAGFRHGGGARGNGTAGRDVTAGQGSVEALHSAAGSNPAAFRRSRWETGEKRQGLCAGRKLRQATNGMRVLGVLRCSAGAGKNGKGPCVSGRRLMQNGRGCWAFPIPV